MQGHRRPPASNGYVPAPTQNYSGVPQNNLAAPQPQNTQYYMPPAAAGGNVAAPPPIGPYAPATTGYYAPPQGYTVPQGYTPPAGSYAPPPGYIAPASNSATYYPPSTAAGAPNAADPASGGQGIYTPQGPAARPITQVAVAGDLFSNPEPSMVPNATGDPLHDLPISISPEETQTGRLMFGVGVNSDAGLVGNITLDEQNFDWRNIPTSWEDIMEGRAWRGAGENSAWNWCPALRSSATRSTSRNRI